MIRRFLLSLLLLCPASWLSATTVTGTVKFQGQPFSGYMDVALVYPAVSMTGDYLTLPGASPGGHLPIVNGRFQTLTIDGNNTLLPSQTFYQFTYYDAYMTPLARLNYYVSGATFDIGAAIPTPVTPANISFLDLLGIRDFSAANASFGKLTFGTGTIQPGGIAGFPQIEGVANADAYLLANPSSTTCGIQEAIAALPSTGGTILLQRGLCTVTSTITITKPLILRGHGQGGLPVVSGALISPTVIANGQTGAPLFLITTPVSANLSGVTFEDIAILGNRGAGGASAGDCIQVTGNGPAQSYISNLTFTRLFIDGCFAHGIRITDYVYGVRIQDSVIAGAGGSGVYLGSSASGLTFDVSFLGDRIDGNQVDGVTIAGATVGAVKAQSSSFVNSVTGAGVNVLSSAITSTFTGYQSVFGANATAGVGLAAGYGHVIEASKFPAGARQVYGINANLPTLADTFTQQMSIKDNDLQGALTDDLITSAGASNITIYPQAEQVGSTNVHYSIGNTSTTHYITPFTGRTCSGTSCYLTLPDGTIEQWGTLFCSGTSCTITFPTPFTTTTGLSVTATVMASQSNLTTVISASSTTAFTAETGGVVFVGGGGGSYTGGGTYDWFAIGH